MPDFTVTGTSRLTLGDTMDGEFRPRREHADEERLFMKGISITVQTH